MSKAIIIHADNQAISEASITYKGEIEVICIFKGMNIQSFL